MSEPVTERELRHAFWNSVICTQGTKRLVARSAMENNSNGPASPMQIFVPQSADDDFDLVLSLCEDGTQRMTVDWDNSNERPHEAIADYSVKVRELGPHRARVTVATPSTSNWALWGDAEITWATVTSVLLLVGNTGYYEMNHQKGFCGLRPPWKNKNDMTFHDAIGMRFDRKPDRDMFAGIDWSNVPAPKQEPVGTGWDELFADEDE